jgi:hypothetical protein
MKIFLKIVSVVLGVMIPLAGFSQDMGKSPNPVYVDKDGKIFVKSNQPIYLRLSTSADDKAPSYLMKNGSSMGTAEVKPFRFEGHGKHSIKHMADHRIPQKSKENHQFNVFDDGKSPKTKVSVTKAPWVFNGNVNIYGKPVTISLKTADESSGVFGTYYTLNTASSMQYQQPILLDQEMDYKLVFYALDNVGNKSRERTRLYSLDFTPPVTTHSIVGGHITIEDEDIVSPRSKISLNARDEKAGVKQIRYRFKGEKGIYKKKLLNMSGLKDGVHSLVYAAEDRVENSEENNTFTFYLDSLPPEISYNLLGDQYVKGKTIFVSGYTVVELTAIDNKAGLRRIRYYFPNRVSQTYTSPFGFPWKNGEFKFSFAASDNVLNVSETTKKVVVVDVTPPKVSPKFSGEHYFSRKTHYVRLATTISLPASDNLSGVKDVNYMIDAASVDETGISYTEPFSLDTEGEHTLSYMAVDNVNNESNLSKINLYVDEKSPEIYHHFSVNPTVAEESIYPRKSLLYLAATDKQSGIRDIYYSINNGIEKKSKKPLSFQKSADYMVKIRVIDNVGNISLSQVSFTIR